MVLETRVYIYEKETQSHFAGEQVHQTKMHNGRWLDTEVLYCVSGGYCRVQKDCHCDTCKAYQKSLQHKQ